MYAVAGGRALAACQVDQVQSVATARSGIVPPGGRGAAITRLLGVGYLLREGDSEQSVTATVGGILKCRGCLPGLRTLLHI